MNNAPNPFFSCEPPFKRLWIFGAGGFAREVAWLVEQSWEGGVELRFLVDKEEFLGEPRNGIPIELFGEAALQRGDHYVAAVGDSALRRAAAAQFAAQGLTAASLVHPRVEASGYVEFGAGSVVCAGCILTTNIRIGQHVHVNLGCTVGHDVSLGDYSTLAPGVHVSGNVSIGRAVFVGTGATIIEGRGSEPLVIGDGAIVAAGACVTRPVEPGALVAGVPAINKR